jgi:FAD/FMN-containing dehydrogenase/Fe-S oxidoreductase
MSEQRRSKAGAHTESRSTSDKVQSLIAELRGSIRGEVRFDDGSRALYATDASNYRQVPIGVVIPRNVEDVVRTVAACRRFGAPVLPRGGGTSLAGQCCNVAVVIDMSKYMRAILSLDPDRKVARVEPGVVLDELRHAAEKHHLTFAPDPATHAQNSLGGMIGNNSCGIHSVVGGKTDDNIESLEILTYDGLRMQVGATDEADFARIVAEGGRRAQIYKALKDLRDRYADRIRARYPDIPRLVSGYNLIHLLPEKGFHIARALVGSEGTCVTVLEATTRLIYSPPFRSLLVLGYPDVYQAADHVPEILKFGPIGLEGIDEALVSFMRLKGLHPENVEMLPRGKGWLLVEFGGDSQDEARERAKKAMEAIEGKKDAPNMKRFDDPREEKMVWDIRESGLGATARVPGSKDSWPGWEDSAVHPENLGQYLRDLRRLLDKYGYKCSLYGHFGQACVHTRIDFDLLTRRGIDRYRDFVYAAADLVLKYGGSFSGEHGDGQSRAELLPKMFGEDLVEAFRAFKRIWDPDGRMNPGKVVDPYRIDENLRLGTGYNPPALSTRFHYSEDRNSLPYATLRCVGVGKCRNVIEGTMCPSYMGTLEEMHSTRGRARLLFEMVQGEVLAGGFRDEHVKEALDLCLSCKSCKGECPVNVDIGKYKAEFLHHYYKRRLRPPDAYAMGLIYWWSRVASVLPRATNFVMQTDPLAAWIKQIAGIAPQRAFPAYARQTFKAWFRKRPVCAKGRKEVILWPDTFVNFFNPQIGKDAVHVLEAHGYTVHVPMQSLCCGRPLFDYGMLNLAKRLLRQVLDALAPYISAGVPVVGLEPACLSTFRDELVDLFPHDQNAHRLSAQSFLLGEFLDQEVESFDPPRLPAKALVHGHCTHKAVLNKLEPDEKVLQKLGLDYKMLDSGCCGISGAFGFRKANYLLSMDIGERVLLPAVREAPKNTLIIADGFSCREQIVQSTDREALHLAQVLCMAMHDQKTPLVDYPERSYLESPRKRSGSLR